MLQFIYLETKHAALANRMILDISVLAVAVLMWALTAVLNSVWLSSAGVRARHPLALWFSCTETTDWSRPPHRLIPSWVPGRPEAGSTPGPRVPGQWSKGVLVRSPAYQNTFHVSAALGLELTTLPSRLKCSYSGQISRMHLCCCVIKHLHFSCLRDHFMLT